MLADQPGYAQSFEKIDSLGVYIFLHDECMITQYYTPELIRLVKKYQGRPIGFTGYFPNPSTTSDRIDAFGKTYGIVFPLKEDYAKEVTRRFGITITPEVAVQDLRTGQLIYRGRIDDSYVRVGKRKLIIQHHDLEQVIDDWLDRRLPDQTIETRAIGCFITFTDPLIKN